MVSSVILLINVHPIFSECSKNSWTKNIFFQKSGKSPTGDFLFRGIHRNYQNLLSVVFSELLEPQWRHQQSPEPVAPSISQYENSQDIVGRCRGCKWEAAKILLQR